MKKKFVLYYVRFFLLILLTKYNNEIFLTLKDQFFSSKTNMLY